MSYAAIERRLREGGIVILDGGTGTELQKRGVEMNAQAWCGPASLDNAAVLEEVHKDYIAAGAEIITANTYASSRLMLEPAGFGERVAEINRTAIATAHRAREASGRKDVLVAGSLSHMVPIVEADARPDAARTPSSEAIKGALSELAGILREEGCDLIILEMMYDPDRIPLAAEAAAESGLPVWCGFSVRRGPSREVLSYLPGRDLAFSELIGLVEDHDIRAMGVMHSNANVTGDALDVLRTRYAGPLMAYPDSGYFRMPQWQFEDVIPPDTLHRYACDWTARGAQIIGGCCGLSPEHIAALAPLKA